MTARTSTPRPSNSTRAFSIIDSTHQVPQIQLKSLRYQVLDLHVFPVHISSCQPQTFSTASPTFARTYFGSSAHPICGHASRSWMIRYTYGLYDEYLQGCTSLDSYSTGWVKSFSQILEDLQYWTSTPVNAVSVYSCYKHQWKELGKKNWKRKSDDVGLWSFWVSRMWKAYPSPCPSEPSLPRAKSTYAHLLLPIGQISPTFQTKLCPDLSAWSEPPCLTLAWCHWPSHVFVNSKVKHWVE